MKYLVSYYFDTLLAFNVLLLNWSFKQLASIIWKQNS